MTKRKPNWAETLTDHEWSTLVRWFTNMKESLTKEHLRVFLLYIKGEGWMCSDGETLRAIGMKLWPEQMKSDGYRISWPNMA